MTDTSGILVFFRFRTSSRDGYGRQQQFHLSHIPRVGEVVIPGPDQTGFRVESVQHHLHQNRVEVFAVEQAGG